MPDIKAPTHTHTRKYAPQPNTVGAWRKKAIEGSLLIISRSRINGENIYFRCILHCSSRIYVMRTCVCIFLYFLVQREEMKCGTAECIRPTCHCLFPGESCDRQWKTDDSHKTQLGYYIPYFLHPTVMLRVYKGPSRMTTVLV